MLDTSDKRQNYTKNTLGDDVPDSPFVLFKQWFDDAKDEREPYAMSLATCASGVPSVRTVLMREFSERGVVFYSHYDSQKGRDLAQNPYAEVLFFWQKCERQVRISGGVQKLGEQASADYFAKRPRQSQIAAWVSTPQSGVIQNREALLAKYDDMAAKFDDDVPKPPSWGGYLITPKRFEFWQGGAGRLHDRILYAQNGNGWARARLMP